MNLAKVLKKELDPHLANPPKLNLASVFYLEAYNLLGTCRAVGFGGLGPIPYTAISQYCRDHGIEGDDMTLLINVVMRLDAETIGDK
ncbi:hypothetical protein [Stenotrophomonas phage BUCT627]|uniref:Uncharacterized protein n=3 Tax=Bixiavirus TaxID=3044676 RepID=A0A7D2HJF0_9CAUD|nr:tail chaperonin [Stenotrophomonas phage vB_SmaS_BUCT548]YP_010677402.1 tail chaperonin [Stenotrophomonas phage BUCT626]YP_010677482.1 tail chaperonin [Stenotrophomonas phage BUCT627]WFG37887.1 hypothetical protein 20Sep420_00002 [Pseudomonas phage 20Sep420]QIQ60747.1 hypothetical protein [Stenotrophomonas phage vB_SmaS_BUCT548]QYC96682.1 hypothetical protein [Stenotrophomonas phage BUCT627]QYC96798.1 hypothetical protein [Stenotrophomonas phage BUCT626]